MSGTSIVLDISKCSVNIDEKTKQLWIDVPTEHPSDEDVQAMSKSIRQVFNTDGLETEQMVTMLFNRNRRNLLAELIV